MRTKYQQQNNVFTSRFRPGDALEGEEESGGPPPWRVGASGIPDKLVFNSWWNEEVATPPELQRSGTGMGVRKQLQLVFATGPETFQLFLDDHKTAVAIAIEHADGSPVRPHELFVGKKLDILGRPTTLRSAGAKTIDWIDSEAKRLLRRREWLVEELSKFCEVPKAVHEMGFSQLYLNRQNAPQRAAMCPIGGQANLQRLVDEIDALEERLRRYRS